jgi:hypothetical protein
MNSDTPSTNGSNGRTPAGKFATGNPGGPGNPFGRRVAALRAVLADAVSEEDIRGIAAGLVASAKAGDLAAVKLLLGYLIGTPTPAPDPDRLATDEAIIESELWKARALTRVEKPGKFDLMFDGL